MKKYTIQNDGEKNIRFTGEEIASASTSPDTARSDYSGSTGRWQVLTLYKTQGGKFVCQRMNGTQWQGERDSYEAEVCDNEAGAIEFFGTGSLAKEIYDEAGIECVREVE